MDTENGPDTVPGGSPLGPRGGRQDHAAAPPRQEAARREAARRDERAGGRASHSAGAEEDGPHAGPPSGEGTPAPKGLRFTAGLSRDRYAWRAALTVRARSTGVAALRGLLLALAALGGSIGLLVLSAVSLGLVPTGVGLITTPLVLDLVRRHANLRRLLAAEWSDVHVPVPYRPFPEGLPGGIAGHVRRCRLMLSDPATWRDLAWLPADMTAGALLALLTPGLLVEGAFGVLLALGLWVPVAHAADGWWYAFVPVGGWGTACLAGLLGCGWLGGALLAGRRPVDLHFRVCRALLDRGRTAELGRRVDRLTVTRHDAVDAAAAELRRIERDLHDGAQARLVAVGLELGTAQALLESDPATARDMLARARRASAEALTELRDLVHGIHPPVLAERGLGDAVRALALRLPVTVDVHLDESLPARPAGPVESAAYFAVSEVLTNAVKHARAERIRVDVHHRAGTLCVSVTDDGRGGAVVGAGSGLAGVERRLGTFDGVLAVDSPPGGPTVITMEIPCA